MINNLMTPGEILDRYPQLREKYNFREQDFGYLIRLRIVNGTRSVRKQITLINIESVKHMIEYLNQNCDNNKIKI